MSHFVPDFETDEDLFTPSSSSLNLPNKSTMAEDEIMELLWQNGQVVVQSQTQQRPHKKSSEPSKLGEDQSTAAEARGGWPTSLQQPPDHHIFMQEDEMSSWLQNPLHDEDFCSDLLYTAPCVVSTCTPQPPRVSHASPEKVTPGVTAKTEAVSSPPIPPATRMETEPRAVQNVFHFSRLKGSNRRGQAGSSVSKAVVRESTMVGSSGTPMRVGTIRSTEAASGETDAHGQTTYGAWSFAVPGVRSKDMAAPCEASMMSSPGVSCASREQVYKPPPTEDRKRKRREADEIESHSEDGKPAGDPTSTKRSRAAEVHNLSERRRRDRINEKMRALQELIPRCNKSDKATLLDEAIEYLKSLQMQVQMMSMGCGFVPMMYTVAMEMGMNQPLTPFPYVFPGSALPNPGHLGAPRFPVAVFPMPSIHPSVPSRFQGTNQPEPTVNPLRMLNPNQPNVPSFADPYQQFRGLHQMQVPLTMQNQSSAQASSSKTSTRKEPSSLENQQSG